MPPGLVLDPTFWKCPTLLHADLSLFDCEHTIFIRRGYTGLTRCGLCQHFPDFCGSVCLGFHTVVSQWDLHISGRFSQSFDCLNGQPAHILDWLFMTHPWLACSQCTRLLFFGFSWRGFCDFPLALRKALTSVKIPFTHSTPMPLYADIVIALLACRPQHRHVVSLNVTIFRK